MSRSFILAVSFCLTFVINSSLIHAGEVQKILSNNPSYTVEQIKIIDSIINTAISEKLPADYLYLRLQEASAKNISFVVLEEALNEKITTLKIASELLKNRKEKGSLLPENIKLLSEFIDRGMAVNEFNELSRLSKSKNIDIDKTIHTINSYLLLRENCVDRPYSKQVFELLIEGKYSSKQIKEIELLFTYSFEKNIDFKEAREVIQPGVRAGKSTAKIKGEFRKKRISEVKEGMKEYEKYPKAINR